MSMNKHNTFNYTVIGVILFMTGVLQNFQANAQRLNPDGLKMVSRVRIGNNKTIDFKYDDENRLQEVIYTYTYTSTFKSLSNSTTYKEVISKNGNVITQSSFINGKPFDHYSDNPERDGYKNFFKYEYHLNEDGKIEKFYIYEYTWAHTIARTTNSLYYEDGKLSGICSSSSYKENKPYYHYDPSLLCKKIYYTHQGFYPQKIYYSLTDEQHKKYAPELTEDEYKESLAGMKRNEYKIDYDSYEYSPNIKNDTNIGFNGLELMSEMGVSSGGDALDNILYYTEWIGLRERNMLMNAKRKERTLVYKYDERGNIVKMIYRYGEKMRKHRVDMEKDLLTISIEYVK